MNPQQASKVFKDAAKYLSTLDGITVASMTQAAYERIMKYLEGTTDFAPLAEATIESKGGSNKQWHKTGAIRNTVMKTLSANSGMVAIMAHYAAFVEYGTSRQPARPVVGTVANRISNVAGGVCAISVDGCFSGKYILTPEQVAIWKEAIL